MFYELISPTGIIRTIWADGVKLHANKTCLYIESKNERDDFDNGNKYSRQTVVATVPDSWSIIGAEDEVDFRTKLVLFDFPFDGYQFIEWGKHEFSKRFNVML